MTKVEALKELAVALGCASSVNEVTGNTISEILKFMADNYPSA